jgi:hypothetical protein
MMPQSSNAVVFKVDHASEELKKLIKTTNLWFFIYGIGAGICFLDNFPGDSAATVQGVLVLTQAVVFNETLHSSILHLGFYRSLHLEKSHKVFLFEFIRLKNYLQVPQEKCKY